MATDGVIMAMWDLEAASCVVGGTLLSWCETERGSRPLAPSTPHLAPEAHLLEGLLLPFRNQTHVLAVLWKFCSLGHRYWYQLSVAFKSRKVEWGWGPVEDLFGSFFIQTVYKE
ncbi:unnamed protein product [Pipistrellus nathusii]|uniref:Uncharacterized protein n=1 Tax=Pipistrellus nathusii TaxID=59473 RepID=A0ABP0ALU0_PIPNA